MEVKRNNKGRFKKGTASINRKHFPIKGEVYGDYTVIDEQIEISSDNKVKFHVKCKCGKEQYVRSWFLKSGRQKSCRECSSRKAFWKSAKENKRVGFCNLQHKGVGSFTKTTFSYFKRNAKIRNIEWSEDLTIDYLWGLLQKQKFKCKYTSLPIELTEIRKGSNIDFEKMTASIDRIDSNKGYQKDNIQWVHKDINRMKWAFPENRFLELCYLVNKYGNHEPSITASSNEGAETNGESTVTL